MATSGVNNTVKWELTNNILTISPLSGDSGIANGLVFFQKSLDVFISLTDEEWDLVQSIVFTGDVSFYYQQTLSPPHIYSPVKDFMRFFPFSKMPNITSIDVSGLNTSEVEDMGAMFSHSVEPQITSIIGLNSLDTSKCKNFNAMFRDLPLSSVDISSFTISETAEIYAMFNRMKYCQRITLPQNFNRKDTGTRDEEYKYFLGITSSGAIPITKDGVTITNDKDFFKLTSTTQGGTWERDLSGVATLSFKVTSSVREGNEATLSFSYLTTSATAEVYLKRSYESSFPSSPIQTLNLDGTGSSSIVLQLTTDDAYDVMIIVDDGETTLYTYPSIDSNVLLLDIDDKGRVSCGDHQGKLTALLDLIYPVGKYVWTSDENWNPNTVIGGTWEKLDEGTTLVSAGETYTISSGTARDGGSEYLQAHKHEFTRPTVNNGGGHSHNGTRRPIYQASGSTTGFVGANTSTTDATSARVTREDSQGTHGHTLAGGSVDSVSDLPDGQTTGNAGNMPPYKAAYCWHRTA